MRRRLPLVIAMLAVALAACGSQDPVASSAPLTAAPDAPVSAGDDPAGGTCLAGTEDCRDDPSRPGAEAPGAPGEPGQPLPGDGAPDDPEPTFVEPRAGLEDLRPVGWDRIDVDVDDRSVTVSWWSGVAPCDVLSDVEVTYGDDAVTVTVVEGSVPTDEPRACIELAQLKAHRLTLEEPIGPRSILDGAEA